MTDGLKRLLERLRHSEDGAVTVDWVMLTAIAGFLGIVVTLIVRDATMDPAEGIATQISDLGPATWTSQ